MKPPIIGSGYFRCGTQVPWFGSGFASHGEEKRWAHRTPVKRYFAAFITFVARPTSNRHAIWSSLWRWPDSPRTCLACVAVRTLHDPSQRSWSHANRNTNGKKHAALNQFMAGVYWCRIACRRNRSFHNCSPQKRNRIRNISEVKRVTVESLRHMAQKPQERLEPFR